MVLANTLTIDTSGGGASIGFGGSIDALGAGIQGLTISAGSGTVAITGAVGASASLASLSVSSSNAASNAILASSTITTTGAQTYTGKTTLGANLKTTGAGGTIGFTGATSPVVLANTLTLDTSGGGASIDFGGSLDGASAGAQTLTIVAGAGNLTFSAAVGATTSLGGLGVSSSAFTYVFGSIISSGAQLLTASSGVVLMQTANASWTASSISLPSTDLFIDMVPGATLTLNANLGARNLFFYNGTLNINNTSLATSGDFVAFGAAYSPDDADWNGGDTRFAYYLASSPAYLPGGASFGGNTVVFGAATHTAAFAPLGSSTITVGVSGNFYVNGADMNGAAWNLGIPDNSASHPVFNATTNATASMWGTPYAVAFNMQVTNCTAGPGWVAAVKPVGTETGHNVNAASSGANWQFLRPELKAVATVYDDVIRVDFQDSTGLTMPIENSHDEIWQTINALRAGPLAGGAWYNSASPLQFRGVYKDPACTIPTTGQGDLSTIYLRIVDSTTAETDASRWNTDATGLSAGAADSTDRGREISAPEFPAVVSPAHRTTVPDLSFLQGLFSAASGHSLIRAYGVDGFATVLGTVYTATVDQCAPVLISVRTGQETHLAPHAGQQAYDAHNYFDLQWSEPVSVGDLAAGTNYANQRSQSSFASAAEHGGHYAGSGTANLTGYFSV
ncbi:MAG TPA: hypothetical protein VMW52_09580, partial [Phycisphaerae bacterium]|nr:hypothetical protein [Phycisphaerae bacterium]